MFLHLLVKALYPVLMFVWNIIGHLYYIEGFQRKYLIWLLHHNSKRRYIIKFSFYKTFCWKNVAVFLNLLPFAFSCYIPNATTNHTGQLFSRLVTTINFAVLCFEGSDISILQGKGDLVSIWSFWCGLYLHFGFLLYFWFIGIWRIKVIYDHFSECVYDFILWNRGVRCDQYIIISNSQRLGFTMHSIHHIHQTVVWRTVVFHWKTCDLNNTNTQKWIQDW